MKKTFLKKNYKTIINTFFVIFLTFAFIFTFTRLFANRDEGYINIFGYALYSLEDNKPLIDDFSSKQSFFVFNVLDDKEEKETLTNDAKIMFYDGNSYKASKIVEKNTIIINNVEVIRYYVEDKDKQLLVNASQVVGEYQVEIKGLRILKSIIFDQTLFLFFIITPALFLVVYQTKELIVYKKSLREESKNA